jgi:hypothetical protein
MRGIFSKLSDDQHRLEIVRTDGQREQMSCETRSYLVHDLLHYAGRATFEGPSIVKGK